ncbi:MAG: tripartite tricarboxylate transporter substrate binding protein [Proteobacteria bacterium]|nr:tripartite tricarboxylate transporter substrate binding protein [Pseudomonadota bacterium]
MRKIRKTVEGLIKFVRALTLLACGAGGLLPGTGNAAYPEQPITMIVAYAPGGGTDLVARAIAPYIEKYLGEGARIIVLNRTGAGGEIGFAALANAPRDGYTIGFINTPPVITIPIERKAAYAWQNLELLGNIVDDPGNFSVHAESPFKNLDDLAAYAKTNPGAVSVGTTGSGSDDHLAMVLFEKIAGVKMNDIPFKGSADVRTALAGKQIVVGAINVGEALQFSKGGAPMRQLGQMSQARSVLAPDLPTFKEQGYDMEMASLRGMAAPKGLPPAIRDRLAKAIEQAAADPGFHVQAAKFFAPLRYLPPAKYEAELREGEEQFRRLWNETPWIDK